MGKEVGKKQTKKRRQPFVTVQRSLSSFPTLAACHLLQLSRLEPRQTLFLPPLFFCLRMKAGVVVPVMHIAFSGTSLQTWVLWELGLPSCGPKSPVHGRCLGSFLVTREEQMTQELLVFCISAGSREVLEHLLDWACNVWEVTAG